MRGVKLSGEVTPLTPTLSPWERGQAGTRPAGAGG